MTVTDRSAAWYALALLFTVLWFGTLGVRALHHPDEGRYAEIAREMHASGDFVTPRLSGLKYFEKPPLQYWVTALGFGALGVHDWTARLPAAVFGWLAIVAVGFAGARVAGRATGLVAASVLAGMAWPIGLGHFLTLDGMLTGWLALALAAFLVAQAGPPSARHGWMLAAWAATAGAVMTKGLVGLVIPGGALFVYAIISGDWRVWRRLALLPGALLVAVLCAPWFVEVSSRNPEFARFFFIHEHVERFLTTEHQREGAWWYFVPLLLLGLVPWTGVLALGARDRSDRGGAGGFDWRAFAFAWAVFVFLFFSASGSKLPSYILPLFPAAALLIGWRIERLSSAGWHTIVGSIALMATALAVGLWLWYDLLAQAVASARTPVATYQAFGTGVKLGASAAAAGCLAAWWLGARMRSRMPAVALIALAMNAGLALGFLANPGLDAARSTADLAAALRADTPAYDASAPVFQVRMYDQTLPWYLRRTTVLVDYRDELALGEDAEPGKAIRDTREWIDRWQALPQAYAVMAPDTWGPLARDGLPGRVVMQTPRYVLVARR